MDFQSGDKIVSAEMANSSVIPQLDDSQLHKSQRDGLKNHEILGVQYACAACMLCSAGVVKMETTNFIITCARMDSGLCNVR